jgi:UDP-N-acetyl-D-mannosaminuronic acid dehydrogenase
MPHEVVARIEALVSPPAPIALLGITYKADVGDVRESPALRVVELAVERGYDVRLCDPHVPAESVSLPAPLLPLHAAVRDAEALVLLVDHAAFGAIDVDVVASLVGRRRVLDTRALLDPAAWEARGFEVAVLGRGGLKRVLTAPTA